MNASCRDCFVCAMVVMEQQLLLAAGTMNREFAKETFRRLKETCEAYGHSEDDRVSSSACPLHRGKHLDLTKALWNVVELLMASFEELNQRDGTLAAELLHLAYYFTNTRGALLHACAFTMRHFVNWRVQVSEFRRLIKCGYHPDDGARQCSLLGMEHIVWFAIRDRRELLLSRILRYGVMFLPSKQADFAGQVDKHTVSALECLEGPKRIPLTFSKWHINLDIFRSGLRCSQQRLVLLLRVLQLLSLEVCLRRKWEDAESLGPGDILNARMCPRGAESSSEYFRSLRFAFDTIPEPFVTTEELRRLFHVAYRHRDERHEAYFEGVLAKFENWYPEGAGPLAPRSLQHLSRCQVRQNLRQAGALPHGIRRLVLPNKIRKYVVLEE